MNEQAVLSDCLRRLNGARIDCMLTDSMVSNFWGIPRTTHDLDFVVQLPDEAVPRLLQAFTADFFLDPVAVRAAHQPPYQFNALDTRSALKVDFWMLQDRPLERTMFARRLRTTLFGEPAWICTAEDVILHKLFWDQITPSDRQLGDAAGVVAVQGAALDMGYLHQWADQIQVSDTLDALLAGRITPKRT